jgi:hypothetical protein
VWDTLERRVRLEARWQAGEFSSVMEYESEYRKVGTFDEKTWKKFTPRERLISGLYSTLSCYYSLVGPNRADPLSGEKFLRDLTPEEFKQFRSKVEPMSEDEIREEYHKAQESLQEKTSGILVMP